LFHSFLTLAACVRATSKSFVNDSFSVSNFSIWSVIFFSRAAFACKACWRELVWSRIASSFAAILRAWVELSLPTAFTAFARKGSTPSWLSFARSDQVVLSSGHILTNAAAASVTLAKLSWLASASFFVALICLAAARHVLSTPSSDASLSKKSRKLGNRPTTSAMNLV
jgi:hypothetical protein